jgi:CBS domain-containing protein
MTVAKICQREVDTAAPDESAQVAAQRMNSRSVGTLLVLDERKRPVGILTDRDLAIGVVGKGTDPAAALVREVMTPDPRTVAEETPIEDALALMRSRGVRRLPVVSRDGTLVGLVSLDDILGLLAEELRHVGQLIERSSPRALAKG